jgi:hypothetical protein
MTPGKDRRQRDRISFGLMGLLGLAAIFAFFRKLGMMDAYEGARAVVEAWRLLGYLVFAALYFLVAAFPRRTPGIWELLFAHKAAMVVLILTVYTDAGEDRMLTLAVDSLLVIVTAAGYFLASGWRAWWAFGELGRVTPG